MRVAAVVVTYNRKALLRQCLNALQAQTHALDQIIVVDNASTDGTPAMVRGVYPEVELMELEENRGGAGGFHAGMKRATEQEADWIWVTDDDAEPAPDALEELFQSGLHNREDTVALTSLKMLPNGQPQFDQTGWYDPLRMKIIPIDSAEENEVEIKYGSFVGLLVRTHVIEEIGLPESDFFIWYDDVEYCMRLAQAGRLYLVGSSRITHYVGASQSSEGKKWRDCPLHYYWRYYYRHRNRMLILQKHVPEPMQRWRGYSRGLYYVLRRLISTLLYDRNDKGARLWLIIQAFLHGLLGTSGKIIDPARFASE